MKSAYLYVRVSTDEQRKKGYSLPEQEDRLLKYCANHNIEVKGIYREDFSAKSFNRPEWKKLLTIIRKKKDRKTENILFVKWDRFSRNIEYAYEMIGILRRLDTLALAIDQPIDFEVPESAVMLAVYLSIPEAENSRRALNTSNGIRRARQAGRHPNKAPLGYANHTMPDGKKSIVPKQPEADLVIWAFEQLAKRLFSMEEVRRMVCARGLKCESSSFWKLVRNPIYCGIITVSPRGNDEMEFVQGLHKPLITEELFREVQEAIRRKMRPKGKTEELKSLFPLRGYLICPLCGRNLTGSVSRGRSKSHPYYHCLGGKCKSRFRADRINNTYEENLQKIVLKDAATELFKQILLDMNASVHQSENLRKRRLLLDQINEQELLMSRARQLYIGDRIEFDDFSELKKEHNLIAKALKNDLNDINSKLALYAKQGYIDKYSCLKIFEKYKNLDSRDKKKIINLMNPGRISLQTGNIDRLVINSALSKILDIR